MKQETIPAEKRNNFGSAISKKLLKENKIPAIVYNKQVNIPIAIDKKAFEKLFKQIGTNHLVNISIGKEIISSFIKEYSVHPLSRQINHIDFFAVNENEPIKVHIPIKTIGTPEGVKEGGVLEHFCWDINIKCLPKEIPEAIEINVEKLQIGEDISVKDLQANSKYEILDNENKSLVGVTGATKFVESETETEEAVEGAGEESKSAEQTKEETKEEKSN